MGEINPSMAITEHGNTVSMSQKLSITAIISGLFICLLSFYHYNFQNTSIWMILSIVLIVGGTIAFARSKYLHTPQGIKNNGVFFQSFTNSGLLGVVTATILTGFYILLYWFPSILGLGANGAENTGLVHFFDPLSMWLKNTPASQWFMYGVFYTICILSMGYKFILKYRHNKYQIVRTISVMFFQLGFAFLLPEFLMRLNYPFNDFKNMWPLNYYFFDGWHIQELLHAPGGVGLFMLIFGVAMIFIISPILTYFYGKRWYCSWVCGCGGLAETAGDPFRQLSNKTLKVWKFERIIIHAVLVFSFIMTVALIYSYMQENTSGYFVTKEMFVGMILFILLTMGSIVLFKPKIFKSIHRVNKNIIFSVICIFILITISAYLTNRSQIFFIDSQKLRQWYGFYIGAAFSGVIGVGFYPIFGSRVWCRFGCPMAAILGLQQRFFSRFRITTNGAQCISCGNCSTYCEMGIDVRSYAQRNQNIVRASCVGCGICAAVCPRGVLKLENGPTNKNRTEIQFTTIDFISSDDVNLLTK